MRHRIEKPPPKGGTEYRIRFRLSPLTAKLFGQDIATAHPGTIKRNLPNAKRWLGSMKGYEAWIEHRPVNSNDEWKKL